MNHNYSDEQLIKIIFSIGRENLCHLKMVETDNKECISFKILYAHEDFFVDLTKLYMKNSVGWFIKNGLLSVYKERHPISISGILIKTADIYKNKKDLIKNAKNNPVGFDVLRSEISNISENIDSEFVQKLAEIMVDNIDSE